MTKLTPEAVKANRSNLADAYVDLLRVANGDKTKLLAGIKNLGGISDSNIQEFESLSAEQIVQRITVTINELQPIDEVAPTPETYSHGQVAGVQTQISTQATNITKEYNDYGVSMVEITMVADHFLLRTRLDKNSVISRLKEKLTPLKLEQIKYFQTNGHELDATRFSDSGELEIVSCSEIAPTGHRNMDYFTAQAYLALPCCNGVNFMTKSQCEFLLDNGLTLDYRSWSYLDSPYARVGKRNSRALICRNSLITILKPDRSSDVGAFRVCLFV